MPRRDEEIDYDQSYGQDNDEQDQGKKTFEVAENLRSTLALLMLSIRCNVKTG